MVALIALEGGYILARALRSTAPLTDAGTLVAGCSRAERDGQGDH